MRTRIEEVHLIRKFFAVPPKDSGDRFINLSPYNETFWLQPFCSVINGGVVNGFPDSRF